MQLERMWINQPSTLQPFNHKHGENVLAYKEKGTNVHRVYFLNGDTISMQIPSICLSKGWKKK